MGYDVHRMVEGRELWLGGILIPSNKGALGHSDADVLLHAICDALLGALSLGDIGIHFSDTDQAYKNIDSKILLRRTFEMIKQKGYAVGNIDSFLVLQSPKISPYVPQMRKCISEILEIAEDEVSIKATTAEQMGFVGERKGIEAQAVALLYKLD